MGTLVLPGESIPADALPKSPNSSTPIKIGPGLRHVPPSTVTAYLAGSIHVDRKKNTIWVEHNSGRYIPQPNDLVIATVHHSSTDLYYCSITQHTPLAQLPQLAFEGATKKTRPQLVPGSLVYARISLASKHMDPELVCYNPSTDKSEGMGELVGGMIFDISLGMARRLLANRQKEEGGIAVLEHLAEKLAFEIAVGRNGQVWVKAAGIKETLSIGTALQETDKKSLGLQSQEKLVQKLLREI